MNPNFDRPFTFDRVVRIIIGMFIFISSLFLLRYLSGVLIPFFIAWLIAYLINPLVHLLQNKLHLKKRILAVFTSLIIVFGSITGLLFWIIPMVSVEVVRMSQLVQEYAQGQYNTLYVPDKWELFLKEMVGLTDFENLFSTDTLLIFAQKMMPEFWNFFSGSLSFITSLFVVFIILLYIVFLLVDFENISKRWVDMIPDRWRPITYKVVTDVELGMNRYFRGQAIIALIVGILFSIGFRIIDLPLAIVLGIIIGILNLVPYLQIIGFIPITMMALLKAMETGESFWMIMLSVIIVFAVIQTFQDGFLVPRIMGKVTGLNPAVILLSLSIWGALFGIVGMIIALPVTTLLVSYYRHFILWEDSEHQPLNNNGKSLTDNTPTN